MVKAWRESVVIPTYEAGIPEKAPVFLENRVYQGSSGAVYPYPVIESVSDEKTDKTYQAVYLENEYIKVMILPELGGRVQMAWDKLKKRHFIYYNQVIKPALVGLTGPWISGGIEINWPQHHRPSTFLPVDHTIESFDDGSVTIWVSEIEKMTHQKGMAGYTLYPGKAYLEIKGQVYNRTPFPQTFLWWANPAVTVNDQYQSVFPPDVYAVYDHGKRDVSTFPVATGIYYKVDYSDGVDISKYKNIPVPTSFMAIHSNYNFVGGYENDTRAGVLHVANHHISPGKKQWTWGNGNFGKAWDRNLTDEDGPYIELMAGVYTDNQPDFSWLQPYEEKFFHQYFLPYRELGVVKNASKDLLLNMECREGTICVMVFATSLFSKVRVLLKREAETLFDCQTDLAPEQVFIRDISCSVAINDRLTLSVVDPKGKTLLDWSRVDKSEISLPEAVKPALLPEEIPTTELLYLTGLHLEQYRHATYSPVDYYQEALRRDAGDARNNNALGLWLLRRGRFSEASGYLESAVKRIQQYNLNPYDGEPLYNLGLCLKYQGRNEEAFDACYKACWNASWQDAGYFTLAQLSALKKEWAEALDEINVSLIRNGHNHKARHLKTAILRYLGQKKEAGILITESLKLDPFNVGCRFEWYFLRKRKAVLDDLHRLMRNEAANYEEIALDYAAAGFYAEAVAVLDMAIQQTDTSPMTFYYKAWCQSLGGTTKDNIQKTLRKAAKHNPDYCFPNRLEAIMALRYAIEHNPSDSRAPYYLGNLWYDKRMYEDALEAWKKSVSLDSKFPLVLRNLSLVTFNKLNQSGKAIHLLEEAFKLDTTDARILWELDQLYKRTGRALPERMRLLNTCFQVVEKRDDLYLEYITLLNQLGCYEQAMNALDKRRFHPWEGGEGKVSAQYQFARIELAKKNIRKKAFHKAIGLLKACLEYPPHLGEGKLHGAQENDIHYYLGCSYEGLGKMEQAVLYWEKASKGFSEPAAAIFYNDQKPEKIYYQGLALQKLHRADEANDRFQRLITYGEAHITDEVKLDFFAVSLPDILIWDDDLIMRNKIHCLFMLGLGNLGLGRKFKAQNYLEKAYNLDCSHQGIISVLFNSL